MTLFENSLRIFLASLSDVIEERNAFFRVIEELRTHVARNLNLSLELVRWEDLRPGLGADGQAVVNSQIGPFDLFIGIFWNRFGTPTSRADSGTREEFDLAIRRWKAKKDLEIWIYFSQKPYNFTTHEELEQKRKVIDFREELSDIGMFREYADPIDFESRIRGDLLSLITERSQIIRIPIYGTTSAGKPIAVPEPTNHPTGWICLSTGVLRNVKNLFALWVTGDSMVEAGINSGDLVILRDQNCFNRRDIVNVLLNNENTTTLKRISKKPHCRLIPANLTYGQISVDAKNIVVQGKVIAVAPHAFIHDGFAEKILPPDSYNRKCKSEL